MIRLPMNQPKASAIEHLPFKGHLRSFFSLTSLHSSTRTSLRFTNPTKFMANPNPTQTGTEVYSVWAFPPESVRARLKSVMSGLRSEFGGPEFEPHITVVGAIRLAPESALEMIRSSTSGLRPYKAKVASVSRGTFFYQCIYLLIEPYKEVSLSDPF